MKKTSDLLKLSVSSIKTYESCHRKWFYTYIAHEPKKDWPHLHLGNFCHAVLEQFHNELMVNPALEWAPMMTHCFKTQLKAVGKDGGLKFKLTSENKIKAYEMLQQYLSMLRRDGMPKVIANEQSFDIEIDPTLRVRGFIDRVDEHPEFGYTLQDFKSGKSKYLDEFQLLVYGLFLIKEHPELERYRGNYIVLGEGCKNITYVFTRTDVDRTVNKIKKVANEIRSDQTWDPKPSFLCRYCDFEDICPAGRPAASGGLVVAGPEDWTQVSKTT